MAFAHTSAILTSVVGIALAGLADAPSISEIPTSMGTYLQHEEDGLALPDFILPWWQEPGGDAVSRHAEWLLNFQPTAAGHFLAAADLLLNPANDPARTRPFATQASSLVQAAGLAGTAADWGAGASGQEEGTLPMAPATPGEAVMPPTEWLGFAATVPAALDPDTLLEEFLFLSAPPPENEIPASVPLPAAAWLFGLAMLGFAWLKRRH